mgnify:CR=1 FL=1
MSNRNEPTVLWLWPKLSKEENAQMDLQAEADCNAGIGIPVDEVIAWVEKWIDGIEAPMPKARKLW